MLNGLSLFAGIGGIDLALAEWVRPVAYCEIERYAAAVLFSRMADGSIPTAPIWPDVRSLRAEILPRIDIIYGGFPCQDVSVAGARKGLDGERTGLFREAVRLVRECKPQFVFLENVPGIRKYVPTVRQELEAIDYDCRDGFLSAAEVGANHRRNRWFLLANSHSRRSYEKQEQGQKREGKADISRDGPKEFMANTNELGLSQPEHEKESCRDSAGKRTCATSGGWWTTEPNVDRVANGIPFRVDRLRGLGNSVCPAQAREAFKRLSGMNFNPPTDALNNRSIEAKEE